MVYWVDLERLQINLTTHWTTRPTVTSSSSLSLIVIRKMIMINWQKVSIISGVINIILVVLLFFKSALNDILKESWLDRKRKKEKSIQRLIDFKTKFNIQQSQNLLVMFSLAQKQVGIIMDKEVAPFLDDTYEKCLHTSSEARSAISELLDYLPADLRGNYNHFDEQFVDIIKNIMEGHVGKEDVIEYSRKMTSLAMEITNLTDSILRGKLD